MAHLREQPTWPDVGPTGPTTCSGRAASAKRTEMETSTAMLLIGLTLIVVLVLAGLITAYVAYPSRGHAIPHASWLSDAMRRARSKIDF